MFNKTVVTFAYKSFAKMPEPGLEILGKRPGNWKVLLSLKALKSIQSMGRSGLTLLRNAGSQAVELIKANREFWAYRREAAQFGFRLMVLPPRRH